MLIKKSQNIKEGYRDNQYNCCNKRKETTVIYILTAYENGGRKTLQLNKLTKIKGRGYSHFTWLCSKVITLKLNYTNQVSINTQA